VTDLTPDMARRFAQATLGHLTREYPHKLDHVMAGAADVQGPAALHPVFHGSFDWHSCVHGWWQVLRLRRLFPDLPEAAEIAARADAAFTPDKVAGELAYLARPESAGFERPYGWAWLLALRHEAARHADRHWAAALGPLAEAFAARFRAHLPRLTYPIRTGTHGNSAFALTLAQQWARGRDPALTALIGETARGWFGADRDCQAWEPGGDEFLSSALTEAGLMTAVLPREAFAAWLAAFLPALGEGRPASLFAPAFVSDRGDGKIVHLDGLNLSRAWCWRVLAASGALSGEAAARARSAAEAHLAVSLPHVTGDYMGEHWLASFALLALTGIDG
jgi:hypothetical protein